MHLLDGTRHINLKDCLHLNHYSSVVIEFCRTHTRVYDDHLRPTLGEVSAHPTHGHGATDREGGL